VDVAWNGITGIYPINNEVGPFSEDRVRSLGSKVQIDVGGYQFVDTAFIEIRVNTETTIPVASSLALLPLGMMLLWVGRRR